MNASSKGGSGGAGAGLRGHTRSFCLCVLLMLWALLLPSAVFSGEAEESILVRGQYEYVLRPGGDAEIVSYMGDEERLTVPKSLDGHRVTAVRGGAFTTGWRLTAVTIPAGVTEIESNPFMECMSLARITVAADHPTLTVTDGALYDRRSGTLIAWPPAAGETHVAVAPGTRAIGEYAFYSCHGLVSVDLPEGVTSIGSCAFMDCVSLTDVSLPDSLTGIGVSAFSLCRSLTEVTLPCRLTFLGRDAFSPCDSLVSVTIPDSLTDIASNPFTQSAALERIVLSGTHPTLCLEDGVLYHRPDARLVWYPAGRQDADFTVPAWVREIGPYAFSSHGPTHVTLPGGMTEIGDYAFCGCMALVSVELPAGLRSIGDCAFFLCHRLNGLELPEGLTRIGRQAFYHCGLTALTLPEGVVEIGEEAFSSCPSLADVSFPSTLSVIGESAFYYCGALKAVSLPEGLTSIGAEAFFWCGALNAVTLPSSLADVGKDAFYNCGEGLVFTVPRGGYAEDFCRTHGYTYAYADAPSVLIVPDVPWALENPDVLGSGVSIGRDRMNLYVYWVQVRLKATGQWYQGEEWDCTGNLGSHTMSEIAAFMRSGVGINHDGTVDDLVIGMLEDVPGAPAVLVGGFYDRMNILTGGERYGDMAGVGRSSPRDAVIWVQTCLKHLGFYTSAIDGDFGSGTLRALHAFQKEYGWMERDRVSYGVARDMLERYAASGGDLDALPGAD